MIIIFPQVAKVDSVLEFLYWIIQQHTTNTDNFDTHKLATGN